MRCELNVYMRPDLLIAHEPCGLFMFILHYIQEWHVHVLWEGWGGGVVRGVHIYLISCKVSPVQCPAYTFHGISVSTLSWGLRAVDDAVSCTTPTVTPTKFIFALTFFLH